MSSKNPRLIAFYLPQFYPTLENDEWWGKGFTEWTNVGRAKPLFKGHYQPRVPADLGYYDLRIPEVRVQQSELASEAGIEGFCYWHYWFAGQRLLDKVFSEVVESGSPDYPFCLCWANHSWYQKTWDPNKPDKLLIEQTYPGVDDYVAHFNAMLPAFKDKRYMKVNGKLIFGVYAPLDIPNFNEFKNIWNLLAQKNGLQGFYFFGFTFKKDQLQVIESKGYDSTVYNGVMSPNLQLKGLKYLYHGIKRKLLKMPRLISYDNYVKNMIKNYHPSISCHPSIDPCFDHSPRSAHRGVIIKDSTPEKWGTLCKKIFASCAFREHEENLIFIKAWNEWGEGNYMEPDLKYGKEYIHITKQVLEGIK